MGGGMCNICLSYLSFPVITYSIPMAGDYIDEMVGKSVGEPATKIKVIKEEELNLTEVRYSSESECIQAEGKLCEERRTDPAYTYDAGKASKCLDQISNQECLFAAQGDFFACNEVFNNGDPCALMGSLMPLEKF